MFSRKVNMDGMPLIQFDILLSDGGRAWNLVMGNAEMGHGLYLNGSGVKVGMWNHLALTMDGNGAKVYLNGFDAARGSFEGTRMGAPMGGDLAVGGDFAGYVWNLKAWNRSLSEAEVKMESDGTAEGSTGIFRCLFAKEGGEGDPGRWMMGAGIWDAGVQGVVDTEKAGKKDFEWRCVMVPSLGVDSVGPEEMEKLKAEYCVVSLKHDEALVRYANEICVKKMLDTASILRVGWEDISPVKEDLTRSPLLRDLSVQEGASEEGRLRPILARWKVIQLFNRTLHSALSYIDLSSDGEGSLAKLLSKNRRLIFRSLKLPIWEAALRATENPSDR